MGVNFNGSDKKIIIGDITHINVAKDLYSEWKKWVLTSDNAKYLAAFKTSGGDTRLDGTIDPIFFILINDWQVVINNGLDVTVEYNLYSDGKLPIYIIGENSSVIDKNSDGGIFSISNKHIKVINKGKYIYKFNTEDELLEDKN